ncbi:hypothetical protein [Psychroserpens algicola]|uniref:Lipocalin-like domain-containing protein n=1 Tax=Psychroserpens algicola TaxID=1719034 RepID=A0ABT0HCQ6_9FLAO|nr:hypothetical protein [Psychroserpens algicola]MCK8481612.1 hypothetical protein [Psychroserpens algicola]
MKTQYVLFLVLPFMFFSCNSDDPSTKQLPTADDYKSIFLNVINNKTQEFTFDVSTNPAVFTTAKGVEISLNTACLQIDGAQVSGECTLEVVELFDKGEMLVTNKPTYGLDENGDKALLISGGEFSIKAYQNGLSIDNVCGYSVNVPANLTGGVNPDMTLWTGVVNDSIDIVWDEIDGDNQEGFIEGEADTYYCYFGDFGWTNLDIFYSDENPQTTLKVEPPSGYDNTNSDVFLSYVGEPNALATLDVFTNDGYFSEHYGKLPIGIQVNLIFVSEDDGEFTYALKTVTIEADQVYQFSESELQTTSASALETLVRNLP